MSNLAFLTKSHKAIAAKKGAKRDQIQEILFDDSARVEYLTGFRKRNLEKKEIKKQKAIERERQEKLANRREQRAELAQKARENALSVEAAYGLVESSELPSRSDSPEQEEVEEYEDEEQMATVTVVEDFEPPTASTWQTPGDQEVRVPAPAPKPIRKPKALASLEKRKKKVKDSSKKYGTNAERQLKRKKERLRHNEKGNLARGRKAGHKK